MGELKVVVLIVIWTLVFFDLIALIYVYLKKVEKFRKAKVPLLIVFSLLLIASNFVRVHQAKFKAGDCFVVKNQEIVPEPQEEWEKEAKKGRVEYQILKIGKKNYLTHSSTPSFGNFSFAKDLWLDKSDCAMIFKGQE